MSTKRLTHQERQAIADDIRAGHTRNDIARRHQRSAGTVTSIAQAEGLSFDRSATKDACEAKRVDNAARRAALVSGLLDDAERLRGQLFAPTKAFNFGGKENTYAEVELDEPTFADKRHIAGAVRMLLTTSIDLERVDAQGDDFAAVDSWLRSVVGTATECAA